MLTRRKRQQRKAANSGCFHFGNSHKNSPILRELQRDMNVLVTAVLAAIFAAACYGVKKIEDDLWK